MRWAWSLSDLAESATGAIGMERGGQTGLVLLRGIRACPNDFFLPQCSGQAFRKLWPHQVSALLSPVLAPAEWDPDAAAPDSACKVAPGPATANDSVRWYPSASADTAQAPKKMNNARVKTIAMAKDTGIGMPLAVGPAFSGSTVTYVSSLAAIIRDVRRWSSLGGSPNGLRRHASNRSNGPRLPGGKPCCCRSPGRPTCWGIPWVGYRPDRWWLGTSRYSFPALRASNGAPTGSRNNPTGDGACPPATRCCRRRC